MPLCSACGQRFSSWYSFDRHVARGACTVQVINTSRPRSSSLPTRTMKERAELKQKILADWQQVIEDPILKKELLHYCVVCNQWFAKNHNLTRHATAQHAMLLGQAKLKRTELMNSHHIKPIRWTCVFCDSCFNSANIHHCSVLLQIALLLVAWTDPTHHGLGGRSIRPAHRSGDEPVQRSLAVPPCVHRRRLSSGKRCEETCICAAWVRSKSVPRPGGATNCCA